MRSHVEQPLCKCRLQIDDVLFVQRVFVAMTGSLSPACERKRVSRQAVLPHHGLVVFSWQRLHSPCQHPMDGLLVQGELSHRLLLEAANLTSMNETLPKRVS